MSCVTAPQHLHNASKAKSILKPLQFVAIGECMLEVQANGLGPSVLSYGGDTFNTAVYLRRCSSPDKIEVSYTSGLGTDHLSQILRNEWEKLGLNLSTVEYIQTANALFIFGAKTVQPELTFKRLSRPLKKI
jgi:sugar/nucleoside kinase (ribokinase family)